MRCKIRKYQHARMGMECLFVKYVYFIHPSVNQPALCPYISLSHLFSYRRPNCIMKSNINIFQDGNIPLTFSSHSLLHPSLHLLLLLHQPAPFPSLTPLIHLAFCAPVTGLTLLSPFLPLQTPSEDFSKLVDQLQINKMFSD